VKLLVYLRDGRTVYRLTGRGMLAKLVGREPWHEEKGCHVERGIWNPETGEYVWTPIRLRFVAKNSISVVEEDTEAYRGRQANLEEVSLNA
jgi:hypothetical protein